MNNKQTQETKTMPTNAESVNQRVTTVKGPIGGTFLFIGILGVVLVGGTWFLYSQTVKSMGEPATKIVVTDPKTKSEQPTIKQPNIQGESTTEKSIVKPAIVKQPSGKKNSKQNPIIVDVYSLLGKSQSQVNQALRRYKIIDRTKITSDIDQQYVGGAFVTYQFRDGVEAMFRFNKDGTAKRVLIENVHVHRKTLSESEEVLPLYGVKGLLESPDKYPHAWNWMDFRDFKVRKVSAVMQDLVSDDGGQPYENTAGFVSDLKFELD